MTLLTHSYAEARLQVRDGDIVIMRSGWTHSPLAAATKLLLGTPYTHTATGLRVDGGVFVAEMKPRLRLNPLSDYQDTDWDVWDCPVDRQRVREALLDHVRAGVDYGWGDLARIAAFRLAGWPLPAQDDKFMVCSAFSAHIMMMHAGWEPKGLPTIAAPDDLARVLGMPKLSYRA